MGAPIWGYPYIGNLSVRTFLYRGPPTKRYPCIDRPLHRGPGRATLPERAPFAVGGEG